MPDGVRNNGIDNSISVKNFLSGGDDEEEEGNIPRIITSMESNGGGVVTPISVENDVVGKVKGIRNNKLPLTAPNSLNLFDLIKTGAMVGGEKNGNSSPKLRLSSGPRDSDYVILVLNQKQREDDEVNMLIDRLRENGVTCLFMKNNGTNNNTTTAKSPTPSSLLSPPPLEEIPAEVGTTTTSSSSPPTKSALFHLSPERKSPEKVQNGKSCGCLCKCNGGGVCVSRTCLQISSSGGSSAISDNKKGNIVVPKVSTNSSSNHSQTLKETVSCPPLILRLPIPVLNITSKDSQPVVEKSVTEKVKEETLDDVELKVSLPPQEVDDPPSLSSKRKRKRRRKYPYVVRKPVKKRRVVYDELNVPSSTASPPVTSDTEIGLSPAAEEVTLLTPTVFSPTTQKPNRVHNNETKPKAKLGRPPKSSKSKTKPTPRPKNVTAPGRKKSKSKLNGLSPSSLPLIQSQQPLLLSSSSSSDDPYVFIPDEFDDFEPVPKLFSPKSGRKNGLCSPNNGFVTSVPSSSPTILSVPVCSLSPTRLNPPLISPSAPPPTKKEQEPPKIEASIASPSPPPPSKEESSNTTTTTTSLSSELKKKTKRKRKNEVCQLLQWAIISPRPSTPRSTLITAFLPKESTMKDPPTKDQSSSSTSPSSVPPLPPPPPLISDITHPTPSNEEKKDDEKETLVQSSTSISHASDDKVTQHRDDRSTPLAQVLEQEIKRNVQEEIKEDKARIDLDKDGEVINDSMPLPFVRVPWGGRRNKGKVVKRKRKKRSELHYKKSKKSKIVNSNNKKCVQEEISSSLLREEEDVKVGVNGSEYVSEKGRVLSPEKLGKSLSIKNEDDTTNLKEEAEQIIKIEDVADNDATVISKCETSMKGESRKSAPPSTELLPTELPTPIQKMLPPPTKVTVDDVWKVPADPVPSTSGASSTDSQQVPNNFLDAMQLRRPSFYSLIAGNVRNNMENFLDGRPSSSTSGEGGGSGAKTKRKRRPRPRNGFLLHHGDNFPEDPEAPYKLHLATQIILKLNKRRSKFKPKEDKGKSLLSYLKLVPKRVSRTSKASAPVAIPEDSVTENVPTEEEMNARITSVFSGEWVQPRNYICNICGHVEKDFWDMVHHKGEIHPGIVVTHVELPDMPPEGFRVPPPIPSSASVPAPPPCTKCSATFSTYPDLHLHIFECAGNTTWLNELKEETQPQRKKKSKRKRGFNRFKRRLSNTPRKCNPRLKTESSPHKRRTVDVFKCEFCTREFKTEGWLKNHLTTHSLPISIPLDKLKQSLPQRASSNIGRRSVVQNLLANGNFKNVKD